jgi:hypothetical protein
MPHRPSTFYGKAERRRNFYTDHEKLDGKLLPTEAPYAAVLNFQHSTFTSSSIPNGGIFRCNRWPGSFPKRFWRPIRYTMVPKALRSIPYGA